MKTNTEKVSTVPRSIAEMKEATKFHDYLMTEASKKYTEFKDLYQLFKVIKECEETVSQQIQDMVANLEDQWQDYLKKLHDAEDLIDNTKDDFRFDLLSKADKLKMNAKSLLDEFYETVPTSSQM